MEDADDRIIHNGNPWEPWMRDEIVAALKEQGPLYILQQGQFNGEQAAIDKFIRSCNEEAKTKYTDLPHHIEHGFRIAIEANSSGYCSRYYNYLLTAGEKIVQAGVTERPTYEPIISAFTFFRGNLRGRATSPTIWGHQHPFWTDDLLGHPPPIRGAGEHPPLRSLPDERHSQAAGGYQ